MVHNILKERIVEYLKQGKRFDSRELEEFREIKVEKGISNQAEGSCSVKIGNTEVWAGVKLSVVEPYPDSPDEGTFMTTVELSPMASNDFESGPPRIEAIELGRIVDRGIRESGFIDFKKLCIKEGEKVWSIMLDIYAVNDDGNLLDVAALAGLIALAEAKMPKYNAEENKVEHEWTDEKLPLDKESMALNLTLHSIGGQIILDPSKEEEDISDYRISIAMSPNKGDAWISSVQKGKEGTIDDLEKVLKVLESSWNKLYPKFSKIILEK